MMFPKNEIQLTWYKYIYLFKQKTKNFKISKTISIQNNNNIDFSQLLSFRDHHLYAVLKKIK